MSATKRATTPRPGISGAQKAALLLVTLGTDIAAQVFRHLKKDEVERLVAEVANLDDAEPGIRDQILQEFEQMARARGYWTQGGIDVARRILTDAVGTDKAREILERMQMSDQGDVFHMNMLSQVDPKQLVTFIQNEHPQTISLILVQLRPRHAASVLRLLPHDIQGDVIARMATMEQISREMITEISTVLEHHLAGMVQATRRRVGGVHTVAELLNNCDRVTEKNIMGQLEETDGDLAQQIRNMMFVFEDILRLDDREIQRVLKEVDSRDLATALKLASDDLKEKIYGNVSERAAEMLKDELEFMGPQPLKLVEECQRRVVETVRRLDEAGEVHISREGDDDAIIE